jgi:glycosyltransferase involved in cell wall biosynthesis
VTTPGARLRVAIVADMLEERWPSMNLVADMLVEHLGTQSSDDVEAVRLRPTLVRRLTRLPGLQSKSETADRVVNRFWDYPRWLASHRDAFDVFHIVDHSYAHLVHVLPAARTVVTCHDTDAFLSLVQPERGRSGLPKVFARRIRAGLQNAGRVVCPSMATRNELRQYGILPLDQMVVAYNGVHAAYSASPDEAADESIEQFVGRCDGRRIDLLHVGSTIPRKRIDLLLRIVAAVKEREPAVRLLKAGGQFTSDQQELVRTLGLVADVVSLPFLDPAQLAALYRRAAAVLVTSDREGFGLPVIEAMACGTPVVATDLPVLREIGGAAVAYAPLGDVAAWRERILAIWQERLNAQSRNLRRRSSIEQAARFRWDAYASAMAAIYRDLAPQRRTAARCVQGEPVGSAVP